MTDGSGLTDAEQVAWLLHRAADAGADAAGSTARRETWLTEQLRVVAYELEQGSGEGDPVVAAAAATILRGLREPI